MAGDIGINEQAIVAASTAEGINMAAAVVEEARGRVRHEYGPSVFIGEVPPGAESQVRSLGIDGAGLQGVDADDVGALGLAAFNLRQSEEYLDAKANRPRAGETWDTDGYSAPDILDEVGQNALTLEAGAPTSSRLMGRVAVGIIIVEGPTADLKFSAAERTKVVAEVQNGLGWLGAQSSPAGVTWVYDIQTVTLTVKPGPANADPGAKEALWRDPAMKKLGFGSGMAGVTAYVEGLRTKLNTDWAYCGFFTKYPIYHFAYATLGGPRLVMNYSNDGWGPDNIDRVFAHETGHIFNAPDEYKASGCNCGGQWGFFKQPNANCESCASGGGVKCIMKSNDWAMCQYTPYHLGFPQGQRYTGVFQAGTGGYGLWVNADWNNFTAKWNEWNAQGLRLEDIEISANGTRYSGVFRAGTGGYGLWANADWNSFSAKWNEWNGQGLRLVDIEITGTGAGTRYTGVFRAGTGGYGLWANADWNSFAAKWNEWNGQGLRLVDLEVSGSGADTRYTGVFQAGTGGYGLWANADWASFQAKWQEWNGQGLRLTDFLVSATGIEGAFSPVPGASTSDSSKLAPEYGTGSSQLAPTFGGEGFGMASLESDAGDDAGGDDGAGFGGSSVDTGTGQGGASILASGDSMAASASDDASGYGAASLDGGTAGSDGAGQGSASLDGAAEGAAASSAAGYGFSSLTT